MRVYGFTGTRRGMTGDQAATVAGLLVNAVVLHHGCCIGADEQAHHLAEQHGVWTVGHPPVDPTFQAVLFCDEMREPTSYLERDANIVAEVGILVAAPGEFTEQIRSGTWATIRRARHLAVRRFIILPDGTVDTDELIEYDSYT